MKTKRTVRFRVTRKQVTIEKNKPLPPDVEEPNGKIVYPFAEMKPGQSFSFQYASSLKRAMLYSVNACIRRRVLANPKERYVARVIEKEGVIRVWKLKNQ